MKAIKVKVKAPFFDENGIHKRGEICTVSNFRPEFMELLMDEAQLYFQRENKDIVAQKQPRDD